ncbi:MAG TPA: hypothetical protein VFI42_12925 [Thermomicrobiaceae bacterium]|nr:hypothetical protein [Thermomicrobiaceae bacterium]
MLSNLRTRVNRMAAVAVATLAVCTFSIEALAAGHLPQLAFMQACQRGGRVRVFAARQIGKSWGIGGALIARALAVPGSTSVFFGLNSVAVRDNFWEPVLQPLLRRFGVSHQANQQRMLITLPNGSRILCTGTDDLTHIQNVLGNRFKAGILAIDEMQSQKVTAVKALLGHILPPTMTPETTLILSGTIPEVPGGFWWDEAAKDSYAKFGWGRVALKEPMPEGLTLEQEWAHLEAHLVSVNPHTPEAPAVLIDHLKANRLSWLDSTIQRDWAGIAAFDPNARTYRFRREVNLYAPTARPLTAVDLPEAVKAMTAGFACAAPLPGVDTFSGAIDPGGDDPCGVELWGWDSSGRQRILQQLFSWVSKRDHRLPQSAMFAVAALANRTFKTTHWRIDSGAKQDIDHLHHDYGLPVIKAVDRSEFEASLRRSNDFLQTGVTRVIDDPANPLLTDYLNAQLDRDALARGQHKWASGYHPTNSECGRYLIASYWPATPPPPPPVKPADPFDRVLAKHQDQERRRLRGTAPTTRRREA